VRGKTPYDQAGEQVNRGVDGVVVVLRKTRSNGSQMVAVGAGLIGVQYSDGGSKSRR